MCAGHTLMQHGNSDRASALLADSLAIYRELGDQRNTAWALASLSFASVGQVEGYEQALACCNEGLSLFRKMGDEPGLAAALTIKGKLARAQRDLDVAEEAYKEALKLSRKTGIKRRECMQYSNLGMVEQSREKFVEAEKYFRQCLKLSWEIGFSNAVAFALAALAGPLGSRGDIGKAATLLGAAAAFRDMTGTMTEAADQPVIESYTAAVQHQMSGEAFESAYSEGLLMDLEDAVAYALEGSAK
jgi:tetratricopeptide (TPR) repeat protein